MNLTELDRLHNNATGEKLWFSATSYAVKGGITIGDAVNVTASGADADFLLALHNAYPEIRKRLEAADKLAKSLESFRVVPIACGSKEAQYAMDFLLKQIERQLNQMAAAYREALK